mgnify:CR=1 FL=1
MTSDTTRAMRLPTRSTVALVAAATVLAGCGGKKPEASAAEARPVTTIGPENIVVADSMQLESGPQLSGELAAGQSAQVRAEVPGSVVQLFVEAGQRVTRGQSLARIDATALNAAAFGARSGVVAAEAQFAQARRELERRRRSTRPARSPTAISRTRATPPPPPKHSSRTHARRPRRRTGRCGARASSRRSTASSHSGRRAPVTSSRRGPHSSRSSIRAACGSRRASPRRGWAK